MKTLYFDCSAGAAGDMLLTSMLDLGLSREALTAELEKLPLDGYRIDFRQVKKKGIQALQMEVIIDTPQPFRHLPEIEALLKDAPLSRQVQEKSLAVFRVLARAEALVHGIAEEKVHFHEVGAVDSILDIVGSILALEMLEVEEVQASPLPLGKGWVKTAHGLIPLPAPATAEILKNHQIPCYGVEVEGETVTPTGAAILAATCSQFSPLPPIRMEAIGYGAGHKDFAYPNVIRAFKGNLLTRQRQIELVNGNKGGGKNSEATGEKHDEAEEVFYTEPADIIEANLDDMNPELFQHVLDCLFAAGAMDVYFTPIQMKKNRPAIKLTVLGRPDISCQLGQIILRETTTLGYRRYPAEKIMLSREEQLVQTSWGPVRVKVAGRSPGYRNAAPEYQDCLEIARHHNIPLKAVYQAVWRQVDI